MERSFRFRVSGLLFLITLTVHLVSAGALTPLFTQGPSSDSPLTVIQLLLAAALAVFASDSIGYVFSSIAVLLFNARGGYSGQYERRLGYKDLKRGLLQAYSASTARRDPSFPPSAFEARMQEYNTEQFLVSFLWHRPDMTDHLNEWVERRHTAYFTAYASSIAILLGTLAALVAITCIPLQLGTGNLWVLLGSGLFIAISTVNGSQAMRDALAIIDFRVAGFVNPKVRAILTGYAPITDTKRR